MTRHAWIAGTVALVIAFAAACGAPGGPAVRTGAALPAAIPVPAHAPAGAHPPTRSTFWRVATPSHAFLTMEKYDPPGPGLHATVVLFPGSPGWGTADENAAARWAAHGYTAVAVCWFRVSPVPFSGIDCPGGPAFTGMSARALADVEQLVQAVHRLPGVDPAHVALVGFSRGGGIVALYAATGASEPVVAISGLFDPATFSGRLAGEMNAIPRAAGIRAPMLIQYGRDDVFVPWRTNSQRLADAITGAGHAPAPVILGYPGGHGISSAQVVDDEYRFVVRYLAVRRG